MKDFKILHHHRIKVISIELETNQSEPQCVTANENIHSADEPNVSEARKVNTGKRYYVLD